MIISYLIDIELYLQITSNILVNIVYIKKIH